MHDKNTQEDPGDRMSEEGRDNAVLNRMFFDPLSYPWTVEELIREIKDRLGVEDAVCRLVEAGLLHQVDRYVWPTRTARRAREIGLGCV